jgi:hypothetical protein
MTGNKDKSCPVCTENKRSDKLNAHLATHVPEIIQGLSDAKLAEHLSTTNPILIIKQPSAKETENTWTVVRCVYCTVCRFGLYDSTHSKDKIKSWYQKHVVSDCKAKFDTIKYLFEAKGKAVIYRPPPAKPKPKTTTEPKAAATTCKEHQEEIDRLEAERDDAQATLEAKTEDYNTLEQAAIKLFEALLEETNKADRLPTQAHSQDDLIHPLDYKKKLLAILAPLYDMANLCVNND